MTQGEKEGVRIEAESNIAEQIYLNLGKDLLKISFSENENNQIPCFNNLKPIKVFVTMKEIESLKANIAAKIILENEIDSDKLFVKAETSGNVKGKVKIVELTLEAKTDGKINFVGNSDKLNAKTNTAGKIFALELNSKNVIVEATTVGNIEISVVDELSANANTSGVIVYKGKPTVMQESSTGGRIEEKK